jgi:beta-galactosidase
VDFVHPGADLTRYDLVLAPALYLLTAADAANLTNFVARGGVLLATYFTGIVDQNERIVLGGYPALLRKTLGLWVEEWCPYPDGRTNGLKFSGDRKKYGCEHWCDLLHLEGAEALATYAGDFFAGRPAITRHVHGKGCAYYLGTRPDAAGLDRLLGRACTEAKVRPVLKTPSGVEATLRESAGGQFLFLLNHTDRTARISLNDQRGHDLISQKKIARAMTLPPLDAAAIQLDR